METLDASLVPVYEKLKEVRESKTCALKPTTMLRTEIQGLDGTLQPFRFRYYQVQGVFHLLMMRRMVLGDACGLGKTVEAIGALCYLWEAKREPDNRVIIVCPKSAIRQWASEFEKFTIGVKTYIVTGSAPERKAVWLEWAGHKDPNTKPVLLINYNLLVRDWNQDAHEEKDAKGKPVFVPGFANRLTKVMPNLVVIYDEATAFKSYTTKTWEVCSFLSARAHRCYGLTATLLKNNLIEGFSIYKVVVPNLFAGVTRFRADYCVEKQLPGKKFIKIIVGYKNLETFRSRIDPFFLGRQKHVVSNELPTLITKDMPFTMSPAEDAKYDEALTGILELGDGEIRDYTETLALTQLIYCQQVVNSLTLLRYDPEQEVTSSMEMLSFESGKLFSKEQALLELITEELDDEKVIVYTRFASLVPRLQQILLKEGGVKSVAITGKIKDTAKDPARERAKVAFQDLKSDVRVIFITDAGSEALNLQAASALVFYDAPWSWGNYVQILGRPIRIGSPHQHLVVYHLIAERPSKSANEKLRAKAKKTIDHYTLTTLGEKKSLIDKVLGESAVGALDFKSDTVSAKQVLRQMAQDAKEVRAGGVPPKA